MIKADAAARCRTHPEPSGLAQGASRWSPALAPSPSRTRTNNGLRASAKPVAAKGRSWTLLVSGLLASTLLGGVAQTADAAGHVRTHAPGTSQRVRAQHHRAATEQHPPTAPPASGAEKAPSPAVSSALQSAEQATGADPALLLAIARRESGLDPVARNHRSSARGLMQFTEATWLAAVRDFGPKHGLGHFAAVLSTKQRGPVSAKARLVTEVLRLRNDPRLAAVMAAERLESWRGPLEQALGRAATPTDLYFVHLLGPAGARHFLVELARAPAQAAGDVVGPAAKANRTLFLQGGRTLSLAEVYRATSRSLAIDSADPMRGQAALVVQVAARSS